MATERTSVVGILRERRDFRKGFSVAMGAILSAFGIHTWVSSAIVTSAPAGMSQSDAGFYGGALSALVFLTAAVVVGWICGGVILESSITEAHGAPVLRRELRRVATVGAALLVGVALGFWPLLGGLVMAVGIGAGLAARSGLERRTS